MKNGKKSKVEFLLFKVLLSISNSGYSPIPVFVTSINKIKPFLELRRSKIRGIPHSIPFPLSSSRQISKALKTVVEAAKKSNKPLPEAIAEELIYIYRGQSVLIKAARELRKSGAKNKYFSYRRWF